MFFCSSSDAPQRGERSRASAGGQTLVLVGSPEVVMRSEAESQQSSLQLCLFLIVFAIDPLILSSDNRRVQALRGCGRGIKIMKPSSRSAGGEEEGGRGDEKTKIKSQTFSC